jgi:heme oxygenase (mycobilin-producing)
MPHDLRLINAFEVSPEADEAFLADWERARESLATQGGFGAIALFRALRSDVDLRFVDVARVDAAEERFASHPSLYEVVHEDGTPDREGGVIRINHVEVPAGEDARFMAGWERTRAALASERGYLGTRLHRSVGAADFRFVDFARWSSPLMFARALQRPESQAAGSAMSYAAHPALYTVIRD